MKQEKPKTEYLSLKEASRISGYSPDYLSYLIRKEKLGGKRIGRDWFTAREALRAYLSSKKYLPVEEEISPKTAAFIRFIPPKSRLKLALAVFLVLIALGFSFFVLGLESGIFSQTEAGDFITRVKLQTEKILIGQEGSETIQEPQEFNVTSYSIDKSGDIEISVQPK